MTDPVSPLPVMPSSVAPPARTIRVGEARAATAHRSGLSLDWPSPVRALGQLGAIAGLFVYFQVAASAAMPWLPARYERWFAVFGSVGAEVVVLGALLWLLRQSGRSPASIGWRSDWPALDVALGVYLTLVVFVVLFLAMFLISLLSPGLLGHMGRAQSQIEAVFPPMPPSLLLLLSAWVACFEEMLFRGFLLTRLRGLVGSWPVAVLIGSVLFALPHFYQGMLAVCVILLLGIVLGVTFVIRRSLVPVIVAHFLFDAVQFLALRYSSDSWR